MHAGMVSKFLNPVHAPGNGDQAAAVNAFRNWRATQIWRLLENVDASALDERHARNFVEHIDENIDPWLASQGGRFPVLIRKVYATRADRDLDAAHFWSRVFVADGMLFCFDHHTHGRQEVPLEPVHSALEGIDHACATYWATTYGEDEIRL